MILCFCWVVLIGGILWWQIAEETQSIYKHSSIEAVASFNKDLAYRRWSASHGGTYVPVTDETLPNPYLAHIEDRDILSLSGKKLTLINPAYMTRQVFDLAKKQYGVRGHITSLNPIRPENAPDKWEIDALKAFERGEGEVKSVQNLDGSRYLRLMRPVLTEKRCLKCHAVQGYKEGDLRGGISVSVPLSHYELIAKNNNFNSVLTYFLLLLLGLAGLSIGTIILNKRGRERFQVEQSLQENEQKYRELFMKAPFAYQSLDDDGKFIEVNQHWLTMMGYSRDEIIGQWFGSFLDPATESLQVFAENFSRFKDVGEVSVEFNMIKKNGAKAAIKVEGNIGYQPDGSFKQTHCVLEDITEWARLEKEKKKFEAQLQQAGKMEAIGTLAGGIAHQFNNALYAVTGNIDLLEMEFPGNEDVARYAKEIMESTHRMTRLSAQLVAYAGGGKFDIKTVSLNDFVRDTLTLLRHTIGSAIHVNTDIPHDTHNVQADLTQMQMVLSAVLVNSSEAIKGKGRIRIACTNETITKETAGDFLGLKPGDHVCLTIEDDGKGMDKKMQARVFDPFFTTKFEGRGLGMAAAYGITRNHGGCISISSKLGKGTMVNIYLPAVKSRVKKDVKSKTGWDKGTGTIMVIEDEVAAMNVTRAMLKRLGYRVLEAKTGQEAIDMARSFEGDIDLAMLDILLPVMGGESIYPQLMKVRPNLKVLIFSGYSVDGPVREILDAGAQDFIQKPFTAAELSEKLKKILENKR